MFRLFQAELKRRRIHWPQTIEATTLDLVERYVANGDGIGLNLDVGSKKKIPGVRALPLENFPSVTMGAVWCGELSRAAKAPVAQIHAHTEKAWPAGDTRGAWITFATGMVRAVRRGNSPELTGSPLLLEETLFGFLLCSVLRAV